MRVCIPLLLTVALASGTFADTGTAIPRAGKACPLGYYSSGGYCIQFKDHAPSATTRQGKSCPLGYYSSGTYCIARSATSPATVERKGNACPLGYYRTGNYCAKT